MKQLGLTDSVDMKVTQGYAQLEIQDKILFKSSESTLLNAGEALLKKLIPLLSHSSGLIYIEGHTDNRPIKTVRFPPFFSQEDCIRAQNNPLPDNLSSLIGFLYHLDKE